MQGSFVQIVVHLHESEMTGEAKLLRLGAQDLNNDVRITNPRTFITWMNPIESV